MAEFAVYAKELLVGHSMLELGDAPMGVVFGVFLPTQAYVEIRRECQTNHADQSGLHLSMRTQSGLIIPCAGVAILDCSSEVESPAEVNVLGIPYPLYGELFPEHVQAMNGSLVQFPHPQAGCREA